MSGTTINEDPAAAGLPRGVTPPSGRGGRFLSDVIVELGLADRETVEQAFEASRAPGKKLGSTLVEMGILSEHELGRAIAERYRLDYLDLDEFDIDPEAAQVIGDREMKRYEAAPVAFTEDGALVVAMVDPADWLAAEEIAQLTGRRVRRAVASAAGVAQVIARVSEANASGQESSGEAFEDNRPAPTRLTLRRVANPLTGGATPPAEHQVPAHRLARVDAEPRSEEVAPAENSEADPHEDGSATPADELAAPEALLGIATGPPTDAAEEQMQAEPRGEEEAGLTTSTGDLSGSQATGEPVETDGPDLAFSPVIDVSEPETDVAEAPVQVAAEPIAPVEPAPSVEVGPDPESVARDLELDQARRDLDATHAELEGMRVERAQLDTELQTTRSELTSTTSELTSARGRLDAALERAADAEHGLGEAHADVRRLEAELAAARDQAESLQADVTQARRQIEEQAERENRELADLRERIEAMPAPAPAPALAPAPAAAEPQKPEPVAPEPSSPPVPAPAGTPASNGTEPPPRTTTPVSANGRPGPVPTPEREGGATKARGLKRLIAAVRRL